MYVYFTYNNYRVDAASSTKQSQDCNQNNLPPVPHFGEMLQERDIDKSIQ